MIYSFSANNRGSKFLDIEFVIENINETEIFVQLPAWRPGRYVIENFAKNIQKFQVKSFNNRFLKFEKVTKDCWKIYTGKTKKIKIVYNYYASQLNAGSTWIDDHQIYINPINCCLYVVGRENERFKLNLKNFNHSKTAISLPKKQGHYIAENFDMLADSPIILSDSIQYNSYEVKGTKFNLWFQGECRPPWLKIIRDFKRFTKEQLKVFGSFPFDEYHFFYQILPYKAYHGVEHKSSTVICFGPGYSIFDGKNYEEFLGVSSHELFHAWNVKTIRPSDMTPYDYAKENYTRMGYLTEGFTTYYGDLILKRSGVFTIEQYLKQINKILDRHFSNYGTKNLSVAESSFDTWLDGYDKGIPNRKSSIYIEGCLLAILTDLILRNKSKSKKSLDDIMKIFYNNYGKNGEGILENDFKIEIEKLGGKRFMKIWENHYYGTSDIYISLKKILKSFGIKVFKKPNSKILASRYGIFTHNEGPNVLFLAPDSPAEKAGINIGDEIIAINDIQIQERNINEWAKYFGKKIKLTAKKNGRIEEIELNHATKLYFPKVEVALSNPNNSELKKWLK